MLVKVSPRLAQVTLSYRVSSRPALATRDPVQKKRDGGGEREEERGYRWPGSEAGAQQLLFGDNWLEVWAKEQEQELSCKHFLFSCSLD